MHECLPFREDHGQDLDDDRGCDERTDAKHDDGQVGEPAAREYVQKSEELAGAQELGQCRRIDARYRDGGEKTEKYQSSYRKANPLSQDRVFEGDDDFSEKVLHSI